MEAYRKAYEEWLSNPYFDEATKAELKAIENDENEIKERFYTELAFGTAGLRGIIGAGTNRMNKYVVQKATQGLANYINKACDDPQKRENRVMQNRASHDDAACVRDSQNESRTCSVAIAYDSRHMSPEFADFAALTLAANGIKAYVFESLRPTPELSFAVRELGCIAGINITASHNPPEYNGYKVYWEDGAQITPPHDTGIMAEVKAITDYTAAKTMEKEAAVAAGLYEVIGEKIDDAFIGCLKKLVLHPETIEQESKNLKIVYTPLHGTGNIPARRVLKELGFENVYVVPEQELPDGDFPTVSYPNPEADEAFDLGLKLAKEIDAELVLATDPDADRLGVRVKDSKTGEYHTLTGNMSGCLLADYEIGQRKALKGLPEDGVLIKTIVTTNMADAIAKYYGTGLIEVLTGFKYIGQQILGFEQSGKGTYLFGFEESYGCLIGTHARDKDAIVAVMALAEAAAFYKAQGKTLWDAMIELYERYGYYKDDIKSITLKGMEGLQKIQEILETLRKNPPTEIGGYKVVSARDYKADTITDIATGEVKPTGLPNSNVLYYDLTDSAWLCVRPSGTEPKVKFYYGVKGTSLEDADAKSAALGEQVLAMINSML
ncbi:MAG: phospho-sugar mutase [Clostridiales bacterium]|nr:phospho-sugar mutase [Clostridiales bacterium]